MSTESPPAASPRPAAYVAFVAGLAGAAIEMVPVLPIQAALGNSPEIVFQSIAAGALGEAAYAGGIDTILLGLFFHVLISVVAAAIYVLAARQRTWLIARPFLGGMLLGAAAYVVMNFIVVPLSPIGFRLPKSFGLWLLSFSIHLVAFGLPIAWIVSRMLRAPARN